MQASIDVSRQARAEDFGHDDEQRKPGKSLTPLDARKHRARDVTPREVPEKRGRPALFRAGAAAANRIGVRREGNV